LDERRPRFEAPQIVVNIVKNRAIKKETLERFGSIAQFIGQQFLRFKPPVSKQSLENRQVCSKHSWGEGLLIKANILLRPRRCADRPRYRAPNRVMFDRPPEQTNARLIFKAGKIVALELGANHEAQLLLDQGNFILHKRTEHLDG